MTYTCRVCGVTSDTDEFYKSVNTLCKKCHKENVRKNRAEKYEYYRQYDAKRYQEDPRVKERHKRYQSTEAGKSSLRKSREKWLKENPEKRAAHVLLGNRLRDGKMTKPDTCQECGAGGRIEGHHEDYAKPLDVMWLCRQCHVDMHKNEK